MPLALAIYVHLITPRFHGLPEWPPSPGRLFQALIAGAANPSLSDDHRTALSWLENLGAPTIGVPRSISGQRFKIYVPNNDLDAVGNDISRIAEIRMATKQLRPRILEVSQPFIYGWTIREQEGSPEARIICQIASSIYQFGRGLDAAYASSVLLDHGEFMLRLAEYPGIIYRPEGAQGSLRLACPAPGSLDSLERRFHSYAYRFKTGGAEMPAGIAYAQPPQPAFSQVSYECAVPRCYFHLRSGPSDDLTARWPAFQVVRLVGVLRDVASVRLQESVPRLRSMVERYLIGSSADGEDPVDPRHRVRIIPLPSIGHPHADRGIRRVIVETPPGCPLRADDVQWAFSGIEITHPSMGSEVVVTPANIDSMLAHYGVGGRHRIWRTVSPAALPESARRRRIDPLRTNEEAKSASERAAEEARARTAVMQALRHAGVLARVEAIQVQREPFEAKGSRAEHFAPGTRFAKERLWHVHLEFGKAVAGPLLIGDGRFLGLGLMAPVKQVPRLHSFQITDGLVADANPLELTRALRRAVIARVQRTIGERHPLPSFFTGHRSDGAAVRDGRNSHLCFTFDPGRSRLFVIDPDARTVGRVYESLERDLHTLDEALEGFRELRAGASGRLLLERVPVVADGDPLFNPALCWESVTPYQSTRHAKKANGFESLSADIHAECLREGLPRPEVEVLEAFGAKGIGLMGRVRLRFAIAVTGPILLGKSRFLGGGLFRAVR